MSSLPTDRPGNAAAAFHLDKANGKLMGVCAGLSNFFGGDPLVWRLVFAAGAFISVGTFVLIYLAIGLLAD